jgi:pyruvate/2-oxoglutarate dehydrogenase complex dihydrolipoamide acyltransferase (E2) component
MTIEVRVPQLPESVADATLVSWHKKPGDAVARDENLVDLETDKVVLEVPAPAAGVLKEIKLANGTTVTSGQVLAIIEEGVSRRARRQRARHHRHLRRRRRRCDGRRRQPRRQDRIQRGDLPMRPPRS